MANTYLNCLDDFFFTILKRPLHSLVDTGATANSYSICICFIFVHVVLCSFNVMYIFIVYTMLVSCEIEILNFVFLSNCIFLNAFTGIITIAVCP